MSAMNAKDGSERQAGRAAARTTALVLALFILAALFVGCAKKETKPSAKPEQAAANAEAPTDKASQGDKADKSDDNEEAEESDDEEDEEDLEDEGEEF